MKTQWLKAVIASSLFLASIACLKSSPIASKKDDPIVQVEGAEVLFSLTKAALADLALTAQEILIQVYKVEGQIVSSAIHKSFQFSLDDKGQYLLSDLDLGEYSFFISLVDASGQELANGRIQAILNPGSQTLPQFVLRPIKPLPIEFSFKLGLNLVNFPSAPIETPEEPAEVRAILKAYRCQGCHNAANPKAGINLQSYPYKTTDNKSLANILSLVYKTVTGAPGVSIMPPSNKISIKDVEAQTIQDFLTRINNASEASASEWVKDVELTLNIGEGSQVKTKLILKDGVYVLTESVKLLAAERYTYDLKVIGVAGNKFYEVSNVGFDLAMDGKLELKLDINYQAPEIIAPLIIDRAGS